MRRMLTLFSVLVVLVLVVGCVEDDGGSSSTTTHARRRGSQEGQANTEAERAARARAEQEWARLRNDLADARRDWATERERLGRDLRTVRAQLSDEKRKSSLGSLLTIIVTAVATAAIVLLARERRIRIAVVEGIRHALKRRKGYGT